MSDIPHSHLLHLAPGTMLNWTLGQNSIVDMSSLIISSDELDDLTPVSPSEVSPLPLTVLDTAASAQPVPDVQMSGSPPTAMQVPVTNRKRKASSSSQEPKPKCVHKHSLNPEDYDDVNFKKSIIKAKQCKAQRDRKDQEHKDVINNLTQRLAQATAENEILRKENQDLRKTIDTWFETTSYI